MITATPVRRVPVGTALRRYRESAGLGLDDAAKVLECDRSKISRIETGQRGIRPKELRELLTEYGVSADEQSALLRLARLLGRRDWRQDHYAGTLPETFTDYLLLEEAATEILVYETQLIPDLLQTPDYARALAHAGPGHTSGTQRGDALAVKTQRQAAVLDGSRHLYVVLAEACLYQQVGGPQVIAAQLSCLAGLAGDNGTVTVQVLPFSQGTHALSGCGRLTIVRLGEMPGLGAVRVPDLSGGHCLTDPADVTCHVTAFGILRGQALTPHQSRQLISDIADKSRNLATDSKRAERLDSAARAWPARPASLISARIVSRYYTSPGSAPQGTSGATSASCWRLPAGDARCGRA